MMKTKLAAPIFTLLLVFLTGGQPAWAFPPLQHSGQHADLILARQDAISWESLSADEQGLLMQHRSRWNSYTAQEQYNLRKGVQRYLDLPPDKRSAVKRKREQYEKMSPEERRRLRDEYQRQKTR